MKINRVSALIAKYMKILIGDFSAKVGKEGLFKTTVWNDSV
jgi:hypothetical protein